jgi:hypothetical protein
MRQLGRSFSVLVFYDVAERIDLARLCEILGAAPPGKSPAPG